MSDQEYIKNKPSHSDIHNTLRVRILKNSDEYQFIRDMIEDMHLESEIGKKFPFEDQRVKEAVKNMITSPKTTVILVAELRGELIGGILCRVSPFISSGSAIIGYIQFLHIGKKWRKKIAGGRALIALIRSSIRWAQHKNVHELRIELNPDMIRSKVVSNLKKIGFSGQSVLLSMEVNQTMNVDVAE